MPDPILIGITGQKTSGKGTVAQYVHDWAAERGVLAIDRGWADMVKLAAARLIGGPVTLRPWPLNDIEGAVKWMDTFKFEGKLEIIERHVYTDEEREKMRADMQADYDAYNVDRKAVFDGRSITSTRFISGRTLLQRLGTEVGREMFGVNFWVDQLIPLEINDFPEHNDWHYPWWDRFVNMRGEYAQICTVSDMRFDNEAGRIHKVEGKSLGEVWLVDREEVQTEEDAHASEAGIHPSNIDRVIPNNGSLDDLNTLVYNICDEVLLPVLRGESS